MRYLFMAIVLLVGSSAYAQKVERYNFGKPATVEGFIKEVIVWENGAKKSAESFAGDKNVIYLSDSVVRITEVKEKFEYDIKELRVDDFQNVTFFAKDETVIMWYRHRRLLRVEPGGKNIEVIYYIE